MTLQQLRYAIGIAETGSFNKAAEKLYISQPSLTAAIRDLEDEMNILIFNRTSRGVTLTNEGEEFIAYARELYHHYEIVMDKYGKSGKRKKKFAVSTQHYSFVVKSFVEHMFGAMMPRGTKRLGLSRMNMGGLGAKMIREIMREKGVSSLEELIDSARSHGVRLVACQMSMDIMGIRKEELIDGVELGGVSTFLGSGEKSDMSLFI